jgi:hypothetical protein
LPGINACEKDRVAPKIDLLAHSGGARAADTFRFPAGLLFYQFHFELLQVCREFIKSVGKDVANPGA